MEKSRYAEIYNRRADKFKLIEGVWVLESDRLWEELPHIQNSECPGVRSQLLWPLPSSSAVRTRTCYGTHNGRGGLASPLPGSGTAQMRECTWKHLIKSEKPSEARCGYFSYYLSVWDPQRGRISDAPQVFEPG